MVESRPLHEAAGTTKSSSATSRGADQSRIMLLNRDVLTERLGSEVAVVNLKTNRFFLLNSTGGRLWELLQSGEDLAAVERHLLAEFEVNAAELRAEVKRMLRLFEDEQLILSTEE